MVHMNLVDRWVVYPAPTDGKFMCNHQGGPLTAGLFLPGICDITLADPKDGETPSTCTSVGCMVTSMATMVESIGIYILHQSKNR